MGAICVLIIRRIRQMPAGKLLVLRKIPTLVVVNKLSGISQVSGATRFIDNAVI